MDYLLDTNIFVYFLRNKQTVVAKVAKAGVKHCGMSAMTLGELYYGAENSTNPVVNHLATETLRKYFTVNPITEDVLREFARQKAFLKRKGQMIEDADILIGATAIVHNMAMVAEKVKNLGRLQGIKIENWCE